ncbi:hypothetical protein M3Y99_01216100 [Aphelenchoides fujianensis]|nr:hypothetical protein M3Y99_01216100 [Aphelenchoides fujianensis]
MLWDFFTHGWGLALLIASLILLFLLCFLIGVVAFRQMQKTTRRPPPPFAPRQRPPDRQPERPLAGRQPVAEPSVKGASRSCIEVSFPVFSVPSFTLLLQD